MRKNVYIVFFSVLKWSHISFLDKYLFYSSSFQNVSGTFGVSVSEIQTADAQIFGFFGWSGGKCYNNISYFFVKESLFKFV